MGHHYGSPWETGAFALHTFGVHDPQNVELSIVRQILFLLTPLWINDFVYMLFSRMIHFFLPEKKDSFIMAFQLSRLFVWADIPSFLMHATGGIMSSLSIPPTVENLGLRI